MTPRWARVRSIRRRRFARLGRGRGAAFVQPSRRPKDGRYGENPNRLQHYYQFQVILKPAPENVLDMYLESVKAIGLDPAHHDIRFVEDDWESPTLGAWGLGWEVWCDGMEITQFTYFQQVGGFDCDPVAAEITYGLERLAMYVQGVEFVYDLKFNDDFRYGEVFHQSEQDSLRSISSSRTRRCCSSTSKMPRRSAKRSSRAIASLHCRRTTTASRPVTSSICSMRAA